MANQTGLHSHMARQALLCPLDQKCSLAQRSSHHFLLPPHMEPVVRYYLSFLISIFLKQRLLTYIRQSLLVAFSSFFISNSPLFLFVTDINIIMDGMDPTKNYFPSSLADSSHWKDICGSLWTGFGEQSLKMVDNYKERTFLSSIFPLPAGRHDGRSFSNCFGF